MRWYRGPTGDQRIWLDPDEIEGSVVDELRKARMLPTKEAPVLDLERFLERHLRVVLDRHADLPDGVLGLTEFVAGRPPRVLINRDLTNTALDDDNPALGDLGRWRATLAHEAAHVLFHRMLYEIDDMQRGLPGFQVPQTGASNSAEVRCLKRSVGFSSTVTDWREIQANRGMAALLMPYRLFVEVAREVCDSEPDGSRVDHDPHASEEQWVHELAKRFSVSRQAARIRLQAVSSAASLRQASFI